ncbi:hypothetical protein MFIFM68171_06832 [Madurella fahalii]|uniref:Zn(2)-C6 fungal-type domain-containing protein n=1 Tax=Madurella fahalii TaxID=1157608 RepID=A0ABQ0GFT9_9PEZI
MLPNTRAAAVPVPPQSPALPSSQPRPSPSTASTPVRFRSSPALPVVAHPELASPAATFRRADNLSSPGAYFKIWPPADRPDDTDPNVESRLTLVVLASPPAERSLQPPVALCKPGQGRPRLSLLSAPVRGPLRETQPAVTIASQLRIQSILSPPDPPDADAAAATSTYAQQPTSKRKFHDAFAAPPPDAPIEPAEPPAPPNLPPPDRLPNIRQPLPRSPPRPAAVAVGAARQHSHTAAADDDNRSPGAATMMAGSPGSPGTADSKKGVKRTPLRSSIACQRCRKSKIKCNNTGGDAPCDTCLRNGKECTYPEVTPAPPKRSEPPTGVKVEQGSERKRLRRIEEISKIDGVVPPALFAEEVLSAPYLTEPVWSQLFDIYRLHFATELPFLHLATLKEKLGSRFRAKPSDTSPEINLVLLGILTLTARFHSTLVSYLTVSRSSPAVSGPPKARPAVSSQDASIASEYYADVLTRALGGLRTSMTVASVERVQAFLMLGLYEWSQARPRVGGMAAWMYVGVAIRMAQALGLGDGDREPGRVFRSRPVQTTQQAMPPGQRIIAKEIRRRTMFSCLILDRLLGCGRDRVSTIRSEDLQIQLPCSEVSFDLSDDVYTGFLRPVPGMQSNRPLSDSVLGRFVRLVDLWGEISKWSFAGGRFTEEHPPWMPESTFFQLREKLKTFYRELPDHFRWSDSNYYKHENHQASSVYVSLHMLGAVCRIMLHREYIPFIPILCDRPVGPLDEPVFPDGQEPPGFWDASAEEVFHAAKEIVDLTEICRDKLPMSSLVLFAVWTAAFVGIYAAYFPHMDTKGHMLPKDEAAGESLDVTKTGPTGLTYKMLTHMSIWLKMAETYVGYFREMALFYEKVKHDYERHLGRRPPASSATTAATATGEGRLSVRLGGGGGLEEWRQQGFKVVNNGEILAVDDDKHSSSRDSTAEPGSDHPDHAKTPRSTSMSFTPINSNAQNPQANQPETVDAAAAEAATQLWRFQQPQSANSQQQQQQQQHTHSPSQSSVGPPIPSPQMPHHPIVPNYQSGEVAVYLEQNQSMPWYLAPGGIDQFAHGTEEFLPLDHGNMFWGSIPGAGPSPAAPGQGQAQNAGEVQQMPGVGVGVGVMQGMVQGVTGYS